MQFQQFWGFQVFHIFGFVQSVGNTKNVLFFFEGGLNAKNIENLIFFEFWHHHCWWNSASISETAFGSISTFLVFFLCWIVNQRRMFFLSTKRIQTEVWSIWEKTSQDNLPYALSTARISWCKFVLRQEQKLDEGTMFEEISSRTSAINLNTESVLVGMHNQQNWSYNCDC